MKHPLTATDPLTLQVKSMGIECWSLLLNHIQKLRYGRNANRHDFSLVLSEEKGTCSSKHALLKKIADENKIPNVQLFLGIYKMNGKNTPKIGSCLKENGLSYLPEAHCYLRIQEVLMDFTTVAAAFNTIEKDLLEEKEITPDQVAEYKVEYHQNFLKRWLQKKKLNLSFEELWDIREQCILQLSQKKPPSS